MQTTLSPYLAAIRREAKVNEVAPALVAAVIWEESRGDPKATRTEPDGRTSRGLMQILDGTARMLGHRGANEELYDPDTNIILGARFLGRLRLRYAGILTDMAAAYNAGSVFLATENEFEATNKRMKAAGIAEKWWTRGRHGKFTLARNAGAATALRQDGKIKYVNQEYPDHVLKSYNIALSWR